MDVCRACILGVKALDKDDITGGFESADHIVFPRPYIQFSEANVFDFPSKLSRAARVCEIPQTSGRRRARIQEKINLKALPFAGTGRNPGIVARAALDSGKTLRVVERREHATDYPILLTVPETLYLKCVILGVPGA